MSYFYLLATVNDNAMNICLSVYICTSVFISPGYASRSGTAGSYGNSILNYVRNCHAVFHAVCTSHSQQCTQGPVSPHLRLDSLTFPFLVVSHVVSVCIFLMTNDAKNLSLRSLTTCITSLEKCLCKSFALFKWNY